MNIEEEDLENIDARLHLMTVIAVTLIKKMKLLPMTVILIVKTQIKKALIEILRTEEKNGR